jgi:hypothetical protein
MLREGQKERKTYYGKENGLVVSPGEQHSGVEAVLRYRDKSLKEAQPHDRSQEGVERCKAEVHREKVGGGCLRA